MKVQDLVDCVECWFECRDGDYGRWVSTYYEPTPGQPEQSRLARERCRDEYVTLRKIHHSANGMMYGGAEDPIAEHALVMRFIHEFDVIARRLKRSTGISRPRLWWRFAKGHRFQLEEHDGGTLLRTRVFIEGCDDYGSLAFQEPHTHLRMAVDNGPKGAHLEVALSHDRHPDGPRVA